MGKLSLGVSRLHGGPRLEDAAREFARVLAGATHRAPHVVLSDDYEGLLGAVVEGRCDVAWMPPLPLARAIQAGAVLACLSQRRGRLVYRSAFVVHKDAPWQDVASLRDARAAWTNRSSAGGYIIPRATMATLGLDPGKLADESFHGSVTAACAAVRAGEADVATCYVSDAAAADALVAQHDLQRAIGAELAGQLRVVGVTPLIPPDGFVLAASLDATFRAQLRGKLAEMHRLPGGAEALAALVQAERLAHATYESMRLLAKLTALA